MVRRLIIAVLLVAASVLLISATAPVAVERQEGVSIAIEIKPITHDDVIHPKKYRVLPYICDVLVTQGNSEVALGGTRVVLEPGETREATNRLEGVTTSLRVKVSDDGHRAFASVRVTQGGRVLASQTLTTILEGSRPPGGR